LTIAMACVRQLPHYQELVFVSDSRVSDDRVFDSCPKILTLPRSDCAIAFSGYTGDAFPMMLQLSLAIDAYNRAKRGELSLISLREHALQVFNGMTETIRSRVFPPQDESPTAKFLFGGYSWLSKIFEVWQIRYASKNNTFEANPIPWVGYRKDFQSVGYSYSKRDRHVQKIGQLGIIGDAPQVKIAKQLLAKRIKENASKGCFQFDMEPFEVVRDMLRAAGSDGTIGGPPQLVVVHQFMQATPIGVYWPDKASGRVSIQGRLTLDYENIDRYILDPDTLHQESPYLPEDEKAIRTESFMSGRQRGRKSSRQRKLKR
jgi:hypothetical protein